MTDNSRYKQKKDLPKNIERVQLSRSRKASQMSRSEFHKQKRAKRKRIKITFPVVRLLLLLFFLLVILVFTLPLWLK